MALNVDELARLRLARLAERRPDVAWEPAEPDPERETLGATFERLVAGKLLIWLGGVALITASFFLIRYSIEIGLVTMIRRIERPERTAASPQERRG